MKVVERTDEYTIMQRRDGRYAVKDADKKPVNGDAKVEILTKHDLIKAPPPPAPEPAPEEAAADEAAGDAAPEEAASEEAAPEDAAAAEGEDDKA